jgi:8-oxo-dGTP pyrophosphatase MutT (NUDIX family)
VEEGENLSEALRREIREELSVEGAVGEKFLEFIDSYKDLNTLHVIFRVEINDQSVSFDNSPESTKATPDNGYSLVWVADHDLPGLDIRPSQISAWLRQRGGNRCALASTE